MARTRIGKKKRKVCDQNQEEYGNSNTNSSSWADMDYNILLKIFGLVPIDKLFVGASMVCREWRLACWDSLLWKDEETLDFTNLKTLLRLASHPFHRSSDYPRRLLRGLKCVMNPPAFDLTQRCLTTTTIIFPSDMYFGGNYELTRVARRSPNLKRLMLPDAYNLEKSLTVTLKMLKDLMELSIGAVNYDDMLDIIRVLGSFCKNFSTLSINDVAPRSKKYYFRLEIHNSKMIAKHLHQLKVFNICDTSIHKDGIRTLLCECKQLIKLSLERCPRIQYSTVERENVRVQDIIISKQEMISAKMEKKIKGGDKDVGWCIDSMESLHSTAEVLDHLFRRNI